MHLLKTVLVAASIVSFTQPSAAQTPSNLKTLIDHHISEACEVGNAGMSEGAIETPDLNGDGVNDLVVDYGFFDCGNSQRSQNCGFRACQIVIYLAREGVLEHVTTQLSIGVDVLNGSPPSLKLMTHDFEEYVLAWDGTAFTKPKADVVSLPVGASFPPISDVGRWVYGNHPVLGLSAYVQIGNEAIGITCAYHGDNYAVADISSIRVTEGLVKDGQVTMLIEPSRAGGSPRMKPNGAFYEAKGNSCTLNTLEWRNGSSVSVLDTAITGMWEDGNGVTFELSDGRTIPPGQDPLSVAGGFSIPLKGSAAAIDQLLRACPMLRQDIEWNCGI